MGQMCMYYWAKRVNEDSYLLARDLPSDDVSREMSDSVRKEVATAANYAMDESSVRVDDEEPSYDAVRGL